MKNLGERNPYLVILATELSSLLNYFETFYKVCGRRGQYLGEAQLKTPRHVLEVVRGVLQERHMDTRSPLGFLPKNPFPKRTPILRVLGARAVRVLYAGQYLGHRVYLSVQ